jgi:tetratricopeptide (TPR) repeat protein
MELPIPAIFASISGNRLQNICECPSQNVQQLLITAYAPRISVISTKSADSIAQKLGNIQNIHHLFTYFENIFAFGTKFDKPINVNIDNVGQNIQGTGCVRFVDDVLKFSNAYSNNLEELFDLDTFNNDIEEYVKIIDDHIKIINDKPLSYETYLENYESISNLQNSIYLKLISLLHLSDSLLSFECFNHPIMQLVVVTGNDSLDEIENLTSSLQKRNLPQWFDLTSILQHAMILVDHEDSEMLQKALRIQEHLKVYSGKSSTVVPVIFEQKNIEFNDPNNELMKLFPSIFCNVKKMENSGINNNFNILYLKKEIFNVWKRSLQEVISKDMILFMNNKINQWTEEIVTPRTSLTGRIFGGRKWGSNNKSSFFSFTGSNQSTNNENKEKDKSGTKVEVYNSNGGYYLGQSSEMVLRKLGDWYFMLGDYKNAYTVYELVKKDMINDKAYSHLASLQEYTVLSLLLGAANKAGLGTQPITPKMVSTVISPMLESSFYSYLSRCNLKTYTIRSTILAAEIYSLIGQNTVLTSQQTLGISSSEIFFNESINLFKKIVDSKLLEPLSNSYLMQRIAYSYGIYENIFTGTTIKNIGIGDDPYYDSENEVKKRVLNPNAQNFGLTRNRKMVLWLLLSGSNLNPKKQPIQTQLVVWKLSDRISSICSPGSIWLGREDGLFFKIRKNLSENQI